MKFTLATTAAVLILGTHLTSTVLADSSSLRGNNNANDEPAAARRILSVETEGKYVKAIYNDGDRRRLNNGKAHNSRETDNIELADGQIFEIKNAPPGWANALTSGANGIKIPAGAVVDGATIDVKGNRPVTAGNPFGRRDLQVDDESPKTPEQERNLAELRRQLATVTGDKTVLAVRVRNTNCASVTPSSSLAGLRDSIFGTSAGGSDLINLHSQYKACSHDKLNIIPASPNGRSSGGSSIVTDIDNGVVEVTVTTACDDGQMRNAVNSALGTAFGTPAYNLANHVMHCIPEEGMGGIAYAYVNSWNSVYKNRWCEYTSTQLHEIGHNLNLAHSNEAGTYKDQSGFMGYSYSSDDQRMCFNGAKSWQLGWYSDKSIQIGGTGGEACFEGDLYGIVDYELAAAGTVVVRIDGGSTSEYVAFNRRDSVINSQTAEGANQVLVTSRSGNGLGYAESELEAKMSSGTYTAVGGMKVTVLSTANGKASVVISSTGLAGSCATGTPEPTPAPTPAPTNEPTPFPTPAPTSDPTPAPVCTGLSSGTSCNHKGKCRQATEDCCTECCSNNFSGNGNNKRCV